MKQALKGVLLPHAGPRRLPLGIGRGVRMDIDFRDQTRLYLGVYEVEVSRHLRRMLAPGMTAFDVGAEYGYDSLVIAKHTRAPVASFECDAAHVRMMTETFDLNPELGPLVTPVQALVGDGPDTLRLDDYAFGADGFVPDFMKIDVEGAELDVLRGATRILDENHPRLLVEVHDGEIERACGQLLVEHGYRPTVVNQRRIWPDRRPIPHNRWLVAR